MRRAARTGTTEDLLRVIESLTTRVAALEKRDSVARIQGPIYIAAVDLGGAPPTYRIELRNEATGAVDILATI